MAMLCIYRWEATDKRCEHCKLSAFILEWTGNVGNRTWKNRVVSCVVRRLTPQSYGVSRTLLAIYRVGTEQRRGLLCWHISRWESWRNESDLDFFTKFFLELEVTFISPRKHFYILQKKNCISTRKRILCPIEGKFNIFQKKKRCIKSFVTIGIKILHPSE